MVLAMAEGKDQHYCCFRHPLFFITFNQISSFIFSIYPSVILQMLIEHDPWNKCSMIYLSKKWWFSLVFDRFVIYPLVNEQKTMGKIAISMGHCLARNRRRVTISTIYIYIYSQWILIYGAFQSHGGTPKSIFIAFSLMNHPLWGTPMAMETPITTMLLFKINITSVSISKYDYEL